MRHLCGLLGLGPQELSQFPGNERSAVQRSIVEPFPRLISHFLGHHVDSVGEGPMSPPPHTTSVISDSFIPCFKRMFVIWSARASGDVP